MAKKKKQPSASGTEYVNAQLLDLKELIDKYADKIRKHALPVRIRIRKKPNKLTYRDGQTIKKKGMVVKAYYKSGKLWGVVPLEDVTLSPSTAEFTHYTATSSLVWKPVATTYNLAMRQEPSGDYIWIDLAGATFTHYRDYNGDGYIAASAHNGYYTERWRRWYVGERDETTVESFTNSYTYNGKTVYFTAKRYWMERFTSNAYSGFQDDIASDIKYIAWTMIYGDIESAKQTITVSWNRPVDGNELTAKFKITVNE